MDIQRILTNSYVRKWILFMFKQAGVTCIYVYIVYIYVCVCIEEFVT